MFDEIFFYDRNTKTVVDDATLVAIQKESEMTKGAVAAFFGLVEVVHNDFYKVKGSLGYMCETCGAPIGNEDANPDFTEWVAFKFCSDCKE